MMKKEIFKKELEYISDEGIRESTGIMLDLLPDYFYQIPASSTGKYHPRFASTESGLVKHTKVAVRIAKELLDNPSLTNFTLREKDLIIMSIILHDGLKNGLVKDKYTKIDHPLLVSNYIKQNSDKLKLSKEDLEIVTKGISSHMGPWNKDYDGNIVLPTPKTKTERFIHMCDYLSSKKFLDVEFDNLDIKY